MLLIYLLIVCYIYALPQYPYNMYNTNQHQDGFCLFVAVGDPHSFQIDNMYAWKDISSEVKKIPFSLVPYCLRMSANSSHIQQFNLQKTFDQSLTFAELQEKNVTREMLLSWSASIDLAEHYEMFLNNISDELISSESDTTFSNCASKWFGPFCRFRFSDDLESDESLTNILKSIVRHDPSTITIEIRCYEHLKCERSVASCLNWQEICNGKIDCLDGSDELDCWQMEINECNFNEYRCQNGQCIPKEFFHDDPFNPDCLDQTDEVPFEQFSTQCGFDPAFRCMEKTCRTESKDFPCGDGRCISGSSTCFNMRDHIVVTLECLTIMKCLTRSNEKPLVPDDEFTMKYFFSNIEQICSSYFEFPSRPILFDHVRFIYSGKTAGKNLTDIFLPEYVCYDKKLCGHIYPVEIYYKNYTCRHFDRFQLTQNQTFSSLEMLIEGMKKLFLQCLSSSNQTHYCNISTMYQCYNSTKCISKHRLVNGYSDCPFDDDETYNESCLLNDTNYRFRCFVNKIEKCFAPSALQNGNKDCDNGEDEMHAMIFNINSVTFFFGYICDGYPDLSPTLIDGKNVTDESDCQYWPCNNTYTQCNSFWSCRNGADEIHCSLSDCPLFYHPCIFLNDTSKLSCLPIDRAGDGIKDCFAGTDELYEVKITNQFVRYEDVLSYYRCRNHTKRINFFGICDGFSECPLSDDEEFCENLPFSIHMCYLSPASQTKIAQFLCQFDAIAHSRSLKYDFLLGNIPNYSIQTIDDTKFLSKTNTKNIQSIQTRQSSIVNENTGGRLCHLGLPIHVRNDQNQSNIYCLCSPAYYGDHCEYENQRVSLTFQVQVAFNWNDLFIFLITLIDHQRNIQSYDYIDYSPVIHCDMKYNIYLIYSNRPKNPSKTYLVQIDALNKTTLSHRSSWIYPIKYPFLPVYRLSVLLKVPVSDAKIDHRCDPSCVHGRCYSYVNAPNLTHCHCDSGWSGLQCDIKLHCHCASDSLCISDSICICPIERYGRRCYLNYSSCHSNPCLNNGTCISSDIRLRNSDILMFKCICPFGYFGIQCEERETQSHIEISFANDMEIPSALLVHFVTSDRLFALLRPISVMKKIPVDKNVVSFDIMNTTFNLAFAQVLNNYYLIIVREKEIVSANISATIHPSHRCLSISELFNQTIVNQHYLQRIKLYPIPCHQRPELVCFYDRNQICLCETTRHVNCFSFDHNRTYSCGENNYCENDGQCLFNKNQCPTSSVCVCQQCYFGSLCQFSTKESTLSLDIIIGSHIRQYTEINQQTVIVKFSIAFNIILLICTFINSILIFLTFQMKTTRDVGCALYLYTSSFTSLTTIIVMTIKFWLLLYSQNGSITNRSFLYGQCLLFDFFIRSFLSVNDWLHSCVSLDRAFNVYQGIHFSKATSKKAGKWLILFVFIFSICSYIYDPIHRYLADDTEDQRTWCLTKYSSNVQTYDWIINIIHISVPFIINIISAILLIKVITRTRSNVQKRTYKEVLVEQFQQHKHLIISASILFILAIPRLIISFLSGCMKSPRKPWLYLFGYFIPFIPTISPFVVFVLPSETYKEQLVKSIQRFRSGVY